MTDFQYLLYSEKQEERGGAAIACDSSTGKLHYFTEVKKSDDSLWEDAVFSGPVDIDKLVYFSSVIRYWDQVFHNQTQKLSDHKHRNLSDSERQNVHDSKEYLDDAKKQIARTGLSAQEKRRELRLAIEKQVVKPQKIQAAVPERDIKNG